MNTHKRYPTLFILSLILALAMTACGGGGDGDDYSAVSPEIFDFQAYPKEVTSLDTPVYLQASFVNGNAYVVDGNNVPQGDIISGGNLRVSPKVTTTYTLVVTGAGTKAERTATVVVTLPPPVQQTLEFTVTEGKNSVGRNEVDFVGAGLVTVSNLTGVESGFDVDRILLNGNLEIGTLALKENGVSVCESTDVVVGSHVNFASCAIIVPPNSSRVLDLQVKLDAVAPLAQSEQSRSVSFTLQTGDISSQEAVLQGLPISTGGVYVEKGLISIYCERAVCTTDLETREKTVLWGSVSMYPYIAVPVRDRPQGSMQLAFLGANFHEGIVLLEDGVATNTYSQVSPSTLFDISADGSLLVFSSQFFPIGEESRHDIVFSKTNGFWSRPVDDLGFEADPVFAGRLQQNGDIDIMWVEADEVGDMWVWRSTFNINTEVLSEPVAVFNTGIQDQYAFSSRGKKLALNADFTRFATFKKIDGVQHAVSVAIDGSDVIDLGAGYYHPAFAKDGRIVLYRTKGSTKGTKYTLSLIDGNGQNIRELVGVPAYPFYSTVFME